MLPVHFGVGHMLRRNLLKLFPAASIALPAAALAGEANGTNETAAQASSVGLRRVNPGGMRVSQQYSHATYVPAGTALLYISGQVGVDEHGRVAAGFEAQVKQAWENLLAILRSEGASASDLVHTTSYLVEGVSVEEFSNARRAYLPNPPPGSTVIFVPRLISPEFLFEIEAIAALR
ncbi:MAG TPA: RidA family protein [Steroidobacter sp.]